MTPKAWSIEEGNYKLNFTGTDNFCFVKDTFTWIKWQAIDCKKNIYKSCFLQKKKKKTCIEKTQEPSKLHSKKMNNVNNKWPKLNRSVSGKAI